MRRVVFIDTSILCNLVPVPGRDQDSDRVRAELRTRAARDEQFVLPITAVIETGNFIAQIRDGRTRCSAAERMAGILRLICEGKAPWVLHDVAWNREFLERFLKGADSGMGYEEHAVRGLGAGDLCLLTERQQYQDRTGVSAGIWSLDVQLAARE